MALIDWKQISREISGSGAFTGSLNISGSYFLNNTNILDLIQTSGIFRQTGSFFNTTNNVGITGSLFVDLNGSTDTFKVKVQGEDKIKVNEEGVLVLNSFNTTPTAVTGGIIYSGSNEFYFGL